MSFPSKGQIVTALFLILLSCAAYAAPKNKEADDKDKVPYWDTVIVRVNGLEITRARLRTAVNNYLPLVSYHSSVSERRFKAIQKKALEGLIDEELLYEEGKKRHISVSRKEIKEELKKLKKRLPAGKSLEKILKESNLTMDDMKEDIKRFIIIKKLTEKQRDVFAKEAEKTVDEAYMKKYYEENKKKFFEPEKVRIREILVRADPGGGRKVWEGARQKVLDIYKRVKAGEDFAKLAKELSQDMYAKKGGDMGWAHLGSLAQEFEVALATMEPGDVSGPIRTIYGYHIIKLEERMPAKQKKFDELNLERLKKELLKKEKKRLWDEWMKTLRDKADIEYLASIN